MKKKSDLIYILIIFTIFLNIWIPKAGVKIVGIPITVGTIVFGMLIVIWLTLTRKVNISNIHKLIIISEFYYLIRIIIMFLSDFDDISLSNIVGYALPLVVYPFIFFILTNNVDTENKYDKIMKVIVYGFFFLCIYALLQYVFGISKVAIPGITVNYSDYAEYGSTWYLQKNNATAGNNSKIVSTYQNGNVFGCNLIIIFPIVYEYLLSKSKKKLSWISLGLFILVIFLTLARSCWLGIILFLLFRIVLYEWDTKKDILKKFAIMILGIVGIVLIFQKFPSVSARILNMNFEDVISATGRTEGAIQIFEDMSSQGNIIINYLFGAFGFITTDGLAYEMLPVALVYVTGIIGLILWLVIIIKSSKDMRRNNKIEFSYKIAILIYFFVSCVEGAYWLVPTGLNLFTVIGLGYCYKKIYINKNNDNKELQE